MTFLREADGHLLLRVHAQPGASRTRIVGEHGDCLKIAVQAPPVDGAANEALCQFLAETLAIPARDVFLQKGSSGRKKVFCLRGVARAEAEKKLGITE